MVKAEGTIIIWRNKSTLAEKLLICAINYSLLIFCIYISKNSTFWTFITGLLFMMVVFSQLAAGIKKEQLKFSSNQEVQEWLDTLT